MNILILYETKSGFTEECAKQIHQQIPGSVMVDIHSDEFQIDDFDTILIGAPIYNGEIEHYTSRYFTIHKLKLLKKRLGIFCAGMNTEEFNYAIQESMPPDIFYEAKIIHCGGRIKYKNLSLKEKFTVRRRLGIKDDAEINNTDKMEQFIKWTKNE